MRYQPQVVKKFFNFFNPFIEWTEEIGRRNHPPASPFWVGGSVLSQIKEVFAQGGDEGTSNYSSSPGDEERRQIPSLSPGKARRV